MALSSSISSSEDSGTERSFGGWAVWLAAGALSVWGAYALLGSWLVTEIADILGKRLIASSQGKIPVARDFLQICAWEGAVLTSAIFGIAAIGVALSRWMSQFVSPRWLWLPLSLFLFVATNAWIALAAETNLFWSAIYVAGPNLKQVAFHAERLLLRDSRASQKVVFVGSSQVQFEIATGHLNQTYYPEAQFANLGYAGAVAFDLLLLQESYLDLKPDVAVCYLSELNLYTPFGGGRFLPFLSPRGLSDYLELWPANAAKVGDLVSGIEGMALPVFRLRRALEFALFDTEAGEMKKSRRGTKTQTTAPETTADERMAQQAEKLAGQYRLGPDAEAQKRSLERFIERNSQAGIRTVLILGQVHPELEKRISADVRDDFVEYVRGLAKPGDVGVVVVDERQSHDNADYGDLMHITPEARIRFSDRMGKTLAGILEWPSREKPE